ncbi:MAG: hypothetical protein ACM3SY_18890 [Candidatus Omnitrophota bacterium]
MLDVQVKDDNINIVISKDLISDHDLIEFLERMRVKQLISESKLLENDAINLDEELKTDWWQNNKDKFLSKIK